MSKFVRRMCSIMSGKVPVGFRNIQIISELGRAVYCPVVGTTVLVV